MSGQRFEFASGNLQKLLALPKYALSALIAPLVPRSQNRWVFGSGIGVGEGALEVALALREDDPRSEIAWIVADDAEAALAGSYGLEGVRRGSFAGYWTTLRAGQIVVTHGLGDVNRFGVFGAKIINLIHGAPLKRLHLDSAVTTSVSGPAPLRALLRRMYQAGTKRMTLIVAGSVTAAERLRSAYRVLPGKVMVLGDPRDDRVCEQAANPALAEEARATVLQLLGLPQQGRNNSREPLVLYAPTWRDGAPDPAVPTGEEVETIHESLARVGARLLIRSHPLGGAAYDRLYGDRVHRFDAQFVKDITPLLGAFDAVITDYSSLALDFSLLARPIVWFAPDLDDYVASRGLYEPLEVTAAGQVQHDWPSALARLEVVLQSGSSAHRVATADARALASQFHAHPEGGAARRVIEQIRRLSLPDNERVPAGAVFFESFYGKQASCNPYALDREIALRLPDTPRFWSVTSERTAVPEGATALLVGSADWFAARSRARLVIVNDWLRFGFRRSHGQTVLQTWHGTMLKRLALARAHVGLRTRLAIRRESRRWSIMLSQNPHSTEQFRTSYAFRGEVLETGYPRDDRLAAATVGDARMRIPVQTARRALGVPAQKRVLAYVPTWRGEGDHVDLLDVQALAEDLGDDWVVVARGHTRSSGSYLDPLAMNERVIDVSAHPDVNDVVLAADLLVTDYSSVMFDAAVARVPMAFFVPDLEQYRDRERGFTFDFEASAPGPLVTTRDELVRIAMAAPHAGSTKTVPLSAAYTQWCERYTPYDDGSAAERVIDALIARGAL